MTLLDEIRLHRTEILTLAKKYGLKDIRIFGSAARGEETPDSDIDMLVDLDRPNYKDTWGFIKFQHEAEEIFKRKVDLVFESGVHKFLKDEIIGKSVSI